MAIHTGNIIQQPRLHYFDGELGCLHGLLLEMTEQLILQLEQTLHALDYADMALALSVIERDVKINAYHAKIETEVRGVLGRQGTLANDLRTVLRISNIADALEKTGNEITDFAARIPALTLRDQSEKPELLTDIFNIGGLIKIMLNKMTAVLESRDSNQAYKLMHYGLHCETQVQEGIKQQLALVLQNPELLDPALDALYILKTLERCSEHCRKIAGYLIFMLDSIDIRGYLHAEPIRT
ncbi:phosphate signaling complex PhoU family protein [Methylomonas methanica]|uniref:Phosphate uptake regulator, PhoU n=1 Tax=Methylomonas methanica (strain DSM 25384 / MC09) TaxID=857087 RepID=G0A455_METMM|nr:PhoU domain-containing protein [Methylomonas methanica]AEF99102.1 phosphate uptake regulator, PhoU [Methylomonas methanica MC09]